MQTREIPHEQWESYFNDLSRRDYGIPAAVEVFGPDLGDQPDAERRSFIGISDDPKAAGGERITITLAGREPTGDYSRTVTGPRRVMVEYGDDGREESLLIESDDGNRTLLRLDAPAVKPI